MSRMLERFQGDEGRELRIEAFLSQTIVGRDTSLAEELADLAELLEYDTGQTLIEQNAEDDDIFLIFPDLSASTSTAAASACGDVGITSVRWRQ